MNVTVRTPLMTRDQFLDWAERQDAPYEFDGFEPVAMTGGTRRHSKVCHNLNLVLGNRLLGSAFDVLPEAGVATSGTAVRFPDIVVTGTTGPSTAQLMPDPLVIFEVVSPSSRRIDHGVKLREYRTIPSLRRYVVVESEAPEIVMFVRVAQSDDWLALGLSTGERLELPELGIGFLVNEIYRGVSFEDVNG